MVKAFNREFDGKAWTEYKGLSNDPRPLSPKAGDVFVETDSQDVYAFNGKSWTFVPAYYTFSSKYIDGGDAIIVVNDGTGELVTLGESRSVRKVSSDNPFDISGEVEDPKTGLILLNKPITAVVEEAGEESEIQLLYVASEDGVPVINIVKDIYSGMMGCIYAEEDVTEGGISLTKGLWVPDIDGTFTIKKLMQPR